MNIFTIIVHAENADIVNIRTKQLIGKGKTDVKYFPQSRPILAEAEATFRAVSMAIITDAPLFVVH